MKKFLFISGVSVVIICLIISLLFFLDKNNILNFEFIFSNDKTTNDTIIEYNKEGGLGLYCNLPSDVKKDDSFECTISFEFDPSVISNVKEIKANYELDNSLGYVKSCIREGFEDDWTLEENGNSIKLNTNRPTRYAENFYYLNVKVNEIPDNKEFTIKLKDIIVVAEDNSMYKIKDSIVDINLFDNDNDNEVISTYKYEHDEEKNVFSFYKFNVNSKEYEYINKYECVAVSCYPYAAQYLSFVDNDTGNMIIVKEVNNTQIFVLLNYEKGVISTFDQVLFGLYGTDEINNEKLTYLIVEASKGKNQIINPYTGKVISDISNYVLNANIRFSSEGHKFYSVEDNMLVVSKDNKWGVIDYLSGDIIVDIKYDDIRIIDSQRYTAKENGKWYLYEFRDNVREFDIGYDEIIYVDSVNMVVQDGKYLYIKDLKGKNLIQDKIEVLAGYNEFACCGTPDGVRVTKDGSILNIYIDGEFDENYNYEVYHYKYDIIKNTLEKVK